jgi:GST-like protein
MIDLYTWTTPNGRKVSILLEELGIPYETHAIDIGTGAQHEPEFLKISPNNRIPAIVDRDTGMTLMESGAIMLYLGHKHGRFICEGDEYWRMMEWLMWQMGGLGPMLGQVHHFVKYNKGTSEYAEERYSKEGQRLYRVLNTRLEGRDFIAGEGRGEYSIADMACWPWISRFEWQEIDLNAYPNVRDWYVRIAERPAVQKGYQVPKFVSDIPMP